MGFFLIVLDYEYFPIFFEILHSLQFMQFFYHSSSSFFLWALPFFSKKSARELGGGNEGVGGKETALVFARHA